ncbi:Uncharacterised protein [Mycobacteroides abscessus subsp. abscessus]|nr:Uncharacterised protein [Mycobacteroides abscessus subsp. abscessus]
MAATLDRPRTPHLDAPYPEVSASPTRPAADEMFTIEPHPCARIDGITACMPMKTPTRFISITLRKCSSGSSATIAALEMPALFTKPVIVPNSASVVSINSRHCSASVTSRCVNRAASPSSAAS